MRLGIVIFVAVVAMVGIYFYYPSLVLKRTVQKALNEYAAALATHDKATIDATLNTLISDDAQIKIRVEFLQIVMPRAPIDEQFTKQDFIRYMDLTLFPMTDYAFEPRSLSLSDKTKFHFNAMQWADGSDMAGGSAINMRYSADTDCDGTILIIDKQHVQLRSADCVVRLRQVPKPGEIEKIKSMEGIADLLKKN